MKKYQTFTEFLTSVYALEYGGFDDEMADAFNDWLAEMDVDKLISYADDHAGNMAKIAMENVFEKFLELQKGG